MATEPTTNPSRAPPVCGDDHGLAVWFTPDAIREHTEETTDDPELLAILERITDDDLSAAAMGAMDSPALWALFDEMADSILRDAEKIARERAAGEAVGRCPACGLEVRVTSEPPGSTESREAALRTALENHAKTHAGAGGP